jgi:predicted O-methyltransferase YrrM
MGEVLADDVEAVLDLAGSDPEPVLAEMAAHGRERGFPIIGPSAGRTLRLLARTVDAERVFEFGSGFGYSAAWWAGALPESGEVVLTDFDEENLDEARAFFDRGGWPPTARFEAGDAMATFREYAGPFDAVLIDHQKTEYVDAFELARGELAADAVVVADNMLAGPVSPASVRAALEGAEPADEHTAGVAAYLEHVRDDPDFETTLLPLGEGIAVSYRL